MSKSKRITLQSNIADLKGVGEKRSLQFNKLGIYNVGDLLAHKPNYYKDLNNLKPIFSLEEGEFAVIKAKVASEPRWIKRLRNFSLFTFDITDGTGTVQINIFNIPYLFSRYKVGETYIFFGKIKAFYRRLQMDNPEVTTPEKGTGLIPYYPLTSGISQGIMRKTISDALENAEISEDYSDGFVEDNSLLSKKHDYLCIHKPNTVDDVRRAHYSLSFKELLLYFGVLKESVKNKVKTEPLNCDLSLLSEFMDKLPFRCTGAQIRAMNDILNDLNGDVLANRLIQGDVGSGKTIVSFFAAYLIMSRSLQSVLLAPTSLLAEQHYINAKKIFGDRCALLTGSTSEKDRKVLAEKIATGEISFLISTHAVLYDNVEFKDLKLVMIDEQQRFGVVQRSHLINRYPDAHLISLTATPIPRSLAMILSGSADLTIIDEMPEGRIPVSTFIVSKQKREDMYEWIMGRIRENDDKAFVVCSLVEESEGINAVSVMELYEFLKDKYKDIGVGFIHGRLKEKEKNSIMEDFKNGIYRILISSTVIETGVDVSDATIIVVENADRFGLSQLHQLRGRVGRGNRESFCYLVNTDAEQNERLNVLKNTNNGFEIAKEDLKFRGAGNFIGTEQHGDMSFKYFDIYSETDLLDRIPGIISEMDTKYPSDYKVLNEKVREVLDGTDTFTAI